MNTTAVQKYSLYGGNLILVNGAHPYREGLSDTALAPAEGESGEVLLERRAATLLDKLMGEIRGWPGIVPVSGWRSLAEQQEIWDTSLRDHGRAFTEQYVAVPGHSEHQTGLAIDLGLRQAHVDLIRPAFPYTGICQTFRQRAAGYGFIQRYPAGKEAVTGIAHEPWHFRYVGMPHAAVMTRMGLTLEEYHLYLRRFPYGKHPFVYEEGTRRFEISFLAADPGEGGWPETEDSGCPMISGNNVDGFIVTAWRDRES